MCQTSLYGENKMFQTKKKIFLFFWKVSQTMVSPYLNRWGFGSLMLSSNGQFSLDFVDKCCTLFNWIGNQLHHLFTGKKSGSFEQNGYPPFFRNCSKLFNQNIHILTTDANVSLLLDRSNLDKKALNGHWCVLQFWAKMKWPNLRPGGTIWYQGVGV
jgi:hypothetical protein